MSSPMLVKLPPSPCPTKLLIAAQTMYLSETIAEIRDAQRRWFEIYREPNYPPNLRLAIDLADFIDPSGAITHQSATEHTLVLLKPDAVRRSLIGQIIAHYEAADLHVDACRIETITPDFADVHYAEHVGKDFYEERMRTFITSGPLMALVVGGVDAVAQVRKLNGATDPQDAEPDTIRGQYATWVGENLVHGSSDLAAAERELNLWFPNLAPDCPL